MSIEINAQQSGLTAGQAVVSVVPAPTGGFTHQLQALNVFNNDTENQIVIVELNDNGTVRELIRQTLIAGVKATQLLTFSAAPADTKTVTIDGKVYTFQTTLTEANGNVLIGVSATTARNNLLSALSKGGADGTDYASAMTVHATIDGVANGANLTINAKIAGLGGNVINTLEDDANLSFGATTLAGGIDPDEMQYAAAVILEANQTIQIRLARPVAANELIYSSSYAKEKRG